MYLEVGNKHQITYSIQSPHVEANNPKLREYSHIFSIQDAADVSLKVRSDVKYGRHQILKFDDVSEKSLWGTPPGIRDIQDIIHFAKSLDEDSVVYVHCFAGISRSTAAALGILVTRALSFSGGIQIGFDQWKALPNSKLFWPNPLMVKLFDEELQLEGKLIKLVNDWRENISEYGCFSD